MEEKRGWPLRFEAWATSTIASFGLYCWGDVSLDNGGVDERSQGQICLGNPVFKKAKHYILGFIRTFISIFVFQDWGGYGEDPITPLVQPHGTGALLKTVGSKD